MTKEMAVRRLLALLRNPLAILSRPMRDEGLQLAREWGITAEDLINGSVKSAQEDY